MKSRPNAGGARLPHLALVTGAALALFFTALSPRSARAGITFLKKGQVVTGPGQGLAPQVRIFTPPTFTNPRSFLAYPSNFTGGVTVATGDVNGDGTPDLITGVASGAAPRVKVFDGITGNQVLTFLAFASNFTGGIFVAAGDVDGDGRAEILVSPGAGGAPVVRIFDGQTGVKLKNMVVYQTAFQGGVRVAAGDVNHDGRADVITGTGPGAGCIVKAFDVETGNKVLEFVAYNLNFRGGFFVASGDVDGDGFDDIITGPASGLAPNTKVFDGQDGALLNSFFSYGSTFTGGLRVAAGDVNGDGHADIVTVPLVGLPTTTKVFDGTTLQPLGQFFAYNTTFMNGAYLAVVK